MSQPSDMPESPNPAELNRQLAEDRYYAGLDLMAEGKMREAADAFRSSVAADAT